MHKTLDYVDPAWMQVDLTDALWALGWLADVRHYRDLILKVIHQTERRVFQGESVPATEKIVSLFEPHTDIIVKKRRETELSVASRILWTRGRQGPAGGVYEGSIRKNRPFPRR